MKNDKKEKKRVVLIENAARKFGKVVYSHGLLTCYMILSYLVEMKCFDCCYVELPQFMAISIKPR